MLERLTFVPVSQRLPRQPVEDLDRLVDDALNRGRPIGRGERIAIAVGSRGIDRIDEVVRITVRAVQARGAVPFIVAAMGSHGGATAAGQLQVLARYGITAAAVGAPVEATMETVWLGAGEEKAPFNRLAAGADGIVVINRVKPHSILTGDLGSGLCRMTAVGLGNHAGAKRLHDSGLAENLLRVARILINAAPIRVGIALVEDAHHKLALVEGAAPEAFADTDRRLLERARALMPTIPFDPLDGAVFLWMGKDISGAGLDPNVIGLHRRNGGPPTRAIHRIGVLRLTEASHGNAIGIGMADFVPQSLIADVDWESTRANALTSGWTSGAEPVRVVPREIDVVAEVCQGDARTVRAVIAKSTVALDRMLVTPALVPEAERHPNLTIVGPPQDLRFDREGRLITTL